LKGNICREKGKFAENSKLIGVRTGMHSFCIDIVALFHGEYGVSHPYTLARNRILDT